MKWINLLILTSLFILNSVDPDKLVVACVGDSITFGARLEHPEKHSYPARLQELLGKNYEVINFGVGGSTLLRKGTPTVWANLQEINKSQPDIIIISLGTNDTCGKGTCGDRKCWEYKNEFYKDYLDLVDTFNRLSSHPEIWVCAPSPMVLETSDLNEDRLKGLTIRKPRLKKLINKTKKVARKKGLGYIDLNTPLDHRPNLFTRGDGVHPNESGYQEIAQIVFEAIRVN